MRAQSRVEERTDEFGDSSTSLPQYVVREALSQIARFWMPQLRNSATDIQQRWNFFDVSVQFFCAGRRVRQRGSRRLKYLGMRTNMANFCAPKSPWQLRLRVQTEEQHSSKFRHRLSHWPREVLPHPHGWNSSYWNLKRLEPHPDVHHDGWNSSWKNLKRLESYPDFHHNGWTSSWRKLVGVGWSIQKSSKGQPNKTTVLPL